jgi:hypothetical protein
MRGAPVAAVPQPGSQPEAVENLVRAFVGGICRRRKKDADPDADQRACRDLARRLVARDPGLAPRLHSTLGLDRVGIDPDDDPTHITANALAIVVMEGWHVLGQLNQSGDVETARSEIEKMVKNWGNLIAGIPGAIDRSPRP